MTAELAGMLLGGLGLLLIGMSLMTEGLKLAAGSALRDVLAHWTRDRRTALLSGFLITAIVQSSSAVTVATIGFANAGLLSLGQAIWVIFGSNVGTTMTGWIVALIGFKLNVEAFALPMVGIGVILKLTGERSSRGWFGQALTGFGLLFLGIGVLKEAFDVSGDRLSLPVWEGFGPATIALYVLAGVLLTTLMQSSSAALVIALSAAEGGLIPLQAAAAVVIGANLGTTTTAVIAVWGATSTAKRVAASHVLFNLATATVAIFILVPMLMAVGGVQRVFNLPEAPATTLAVFHTTFNLLGVALMWPLSERLVSVLSRRFQTQEEVESRPKYLDRTSLGLPFLASEALANEISRIGSLAAGAVMAALSAERGGAEILDDDEQVSRSLAGAVGGYIAEFSRTALPAAIANLLPNLLRAAQQYATVINLARQAIAAQRETGVLENQRIAAPLLAFRQQIARLVDAVDFAERQFGLDKAEADAELLERRYNALKQCALEEGAGGRLDVVRMDALLRYASLARRVAKQFIKATRRLATVRHVLSSSGKGDDASSRVGDSPAAPPSG